MLPRPLREQFLAQVRRMLRPVVRQLIAYGVPYLVFDEMVRGLYVEVAERDLALPHKRPTDSRVSLVTGLHRKEIARLRQLPLESRAPATVEDALVTRVIGRWMAGPPYADRRGRARSLPYDSARPRVASFAHLVREQSVDVPVRSVLDELLRLEAVELTTAGEVILRKEAHIPAGDAAGKLSLLGSDPAEVFSSIVHNIEQPETPWLQRKVVYDNIGAEALAELREEARQVGGEFIRRANALLASRDRDRTPDAPGGRRSRVVLGAYYFEESVAPPEPAANAEGAAGRRAAPPGRIKRSR